MDRLRDYVRDDFGIALATLTPVRGGADEHAEMWRGVGPGGDAYAVKLSGGGSPAGLAVAAHLGARGVPGIAAPRPARDGRPWSERDGARLSVLPWIDDPAAWRGTMTPAHWVAYGRVLAALHATDVPPAIAGRLPRETHTHDRFVEVTRRVTDRVAADPAVAALWPVASVEALAARADALAPGLRARGDADAVVCHGDPHLLNVLSGGADRVWLIDWDDVVLAPREWDLMFVIGGVLAPVPPAERSWFLDGYGPVDLDPDRLAYYRCVRALDDAGGWATTALDADPAEERAEARDILRYIFGPDGLGTLALSG